MKKYIKLETVNDSGSDWQNTVDLKIMINLPHWGLLAPFIVSA